jgi:2-keto-4-pentenoate hydratase/2-oxohepta-3-ene-1,7-dioic acid hydratase in catechol pathway
MSYVAGYTASNDVSSRAQQFAQSQWCYSKSFDGACPIGPAFVPASQVKDIGEMTIEGRKNGDVVQKSKLECVPLFFMKGAPLLCDLPS